MVSNVLLKGLDLKTMSTRRLNGVAVALSMAFILGFALAPSVAVAQAQDNPKQSVAPTIKTGLDAPASAPGLPNVPYDYKIGEGDSLVINVWKEPDATMAQSKTNPTA